MEVWKNFVRDRMEEGEKMLAEDSMFVQHGRVPEIKLWGIEDDLITHPGKPQFCSDGSLK